jgi:hypothetical protein
LTDSWDPSPRDADWDPAGGNLGVFRLADEGDLGGVDVGMPGELAHLMHGRALRMASLITVLRSE